MPLPENQKKKESIYSRTSTLWCILWCILQCIQQNSP